METNRAWCNEFMKWDLWAYGNLNWFWSPQLKNQESRKKFERMQFLTERGLDAFGRVLITTHKPFLEPLRSFFPLKTCRKNGNTHAMQLSRTFSPVCLDKAKSAMRDEDTDKATRKSITQSEGWWFEVTWASETTCNGTNLSPWWIRTFT